MCAHAHKMRREFHNVCKLPPLLKKDIGPLPLYLTVISVEVISRVRLNPHRYKLGLLN